MEKTCFVISPIGEDNSLTRKRSDHLLHYIIKPSIASFGYKVVRADQISQPGLITTQVITSLVHAELVIADLTDSNPNVFYELGIRHTLQKPYIQLIEAGQKIPFDILAARTIYYDLTDPERIESAKEELKRQLDYVSSGDLKSIDSPVTYSFELTQLSKSDKPAEKDIGSYLNLIQNLQLEMSNLTNSIKLDLEEIKRKLNMSEDITEKKREALSKLERIQKGLNK